MANIKEVLSNVNSTIDTAMQFGEPSADKFTEVDRGNGKVAVKRVYDFVNTVGKRSQLTTFDSEVIRITETIARAIMHREKASYIICRELYHMKESGKLGSMGFKNVGEYGKAMFDLAPLTCNQYARVGEYFIDDEYNTVKDLPRLSVSHYIEFLSFIEKKGGSVEELQNLFIEGKLVDGMSTKKMRGVLEAAKTSKGAIETSFSDNNTNDTNEGDDTNDTNEGNEGNDTNDTNEGNEGNDTNDTDEDKPFNKVDTLNKGLTAIQTLYRVSEELKANGISVSFTDSLDEVMEGIKKLFD